jgi:hypothetical protein
MCRAACWLVVVLFTIAATGGCDDRPKDQVPTKIEPAPKIEPKPDADRSSSGPRQ